jgi:tight adherence protein C
MMVPIVFLILPISILFALWPSLSNLNQFVG